MCIRIALRQTYHTSVGLGDYLDVVAGILIILKYIRSIEEHLDLDLRMEKRLPRYVVFVLFMEVLF